MASDYHGRIMNIRHPAGDDPATAEAKLAARDIRHAAAEIAAGADDEVRRLTAERDTAVAALAQREVECARLRMAGGLLAEEVERALHHTDKGHRNLRLRLADFRTAERDAALSQQEAGNGQ